MIDAWHYLTRTVAARVEIDQVIRQISHVYYAFRVGIGSFKANAMPFLPV